MVKVDSAIRKQQIHIMSLLFDTNDEIDNEYEAHKLINDKLRELKDSNNLDNFNISLMVKDVSRRKWKSGLSDPNLFIKLFFNEIEYVKRTSELTRAEVLFLYSLSSYLLWEENLLVDEEGIPLNQKKLCKVLDIDRKTVYKNIKSLEEKKCLIRIWDGREIYFLINPYLMFFGEKINKSLPQLFEMIGYISLKNSKKQLKNSV